MADYEILKTAIYNALGIGAENARTRRELCRAVMCSDRLLRQNSRRRAIWRATRGARLFVMAEKEMAE